MITPFFRSSLINCFTLCEHKMFLEYNIGYRGFNNTKSLIGSVVHGVLECLLLEKLSLKNKVNIVNHESFGKWELDSRSHSDHLDIVYKYYDEESPNLFKDDSYRDCEKLIDKALTFQDGAFHPWNNDPFAAEYQFELTLQDKWAAYSYNSPDGEISGQLTLKGTVDCIYIEDDNTMCVVDYKTGSTLADWATGKEKNDISLYNDPQLMLYYYVLANIFPDKEIVMTLYFVRLEKAFTIAFSRKDLKRIKEWIKEQFTYIQSIKKPAFIDGTDMGWKCFRFCPFYKNKMVGSKKNICRFFRDEITNKGYEQTMLEHANYSLINSYGAGGSSKDRE